LTTESGARDQLNNGSGGRSVLEALARFSAIQELDLAAARVGRRFLPRSEFIAWRTTEISGIGSADDRFTELSPLVLAGTRIAELGGRTAPEEVARLLATTPADSRLGDLKAFQAALGRLAKADPADVDTALRACLGACSHRLDAWFTSVAGRQLEAVRARRPKGTHVGGFGYVENLRPEQTADSLGYVLAPSVAHAVTAGLLRSGYLAQEATGTESLDVDLSSDRVKLALELMRGVIAGVPLSVLLGYRIERALRDAGLSVLILPLRTVFPLRTPPPAEVPAGAIESTPPNNVTEGARLLERWESERDTVLDDVRQEAKPSPDDATLDALASEIDVLADVYVALADVVLAEAVHQLARGQPERAQAATRFLDRQEPPVEPDVTASPRTSSGYVQRCLVALSAEAPGAAWQGLADPRSSAEPRLNSWLAGLLGTPGRWKFSGRLIRADGKTGGKAVVTPAELDLSPLSLVVAAGGGSPDQPTELEERMARLLTAKLSPAEGESIELLPETAGALGIAAFAALASAARRVLRAATPADARAFARPDATVESRLDVADLKRRADAAASALRSAVTALDAAIAEPSTQTEVADALERASRLGVGGAVPPAGILAGSAAAAPRAALDLAGDVAAAAHGRLEQLNELQATQPAPGAAAAHHQRRIATVFGDSFPVLGAFTVPDGWHAARSLSPAAQTSLLRGDPLAPVTWMTRMARVRPELDALWHLLVSAEAASSYKASAFAVAQIPQAPAAAWAALSFGHDRPTADVAIAVHAPSGLRGPIAALTVDAWTEQLPLPTETAGAAFHYDAPSNRAPQSAILAVPPQLTEQPWNLDTIAETVLEAFDLALIRGVNLHDLPAVGTVLPALYLPFDPGGNVPGINLDRLADSLGPAQLVLGRD
jgi:hypothetical protein